MHNLRLQDLSIEIVKTSTSVYQCTWRGKSQDRNPGETLQLWLDALIATVIDTGGSIEMHFEHIEHFNSSTITVLVRLIQACRAKKVALVMVYNDALRWQVLSFDALRVFVMNDSLFQLRAA